MTTLYTAPINGGPFNCAPAGQWQLPDDRILCDNVVLPGEYNPCHIKLWVIGNEYGPLGAVWASCEQDALDNLVDAGLGDGLLVDEADADEDCASLGNAGEPANLDYAWLRVVVFEPARDWQTLCKFAEARGAGNTTLDR